MASSTNMSSNVMIASSRSMMFSVLILTMNSNQKYAMTENCKAITMAESVYDAGHITRCAVPGKNMIRAELAPQT